MIAEMLHYHISIKNDTKIIAYAYLSPSSCDMTMLYLNDISHYGLALKEGELLEVIQAIIKFAKMLGFVTLRTEYDDPAFYEAGFESRRETAKYWEGVLEIKL